MEEREKATIEQLYEQLGNNFDITICSDIVNGLYFEYKQLYYENEQLKEQVKQYTDPEDLTLMYMYCDEKAKDKIKDLKEQLKSSEKARKEAIDYIEKFVPIDVDTILMREKQRDYLIEILDIDKGE